MILSGSISSKITVSSAYTLLLLVTLLPAVIPAYSQTPTLTRVSPAPEIGGRFGGDVDVLRDDISGDGVRDLIIGAWDEGKIYTISGDDDIVIRTIDENVSISRPAVIFSTTDLTGDGTVDYGFASEGNVTIISGINGEVVGQVSSPSSEGVTRFGIHATGIPDVSGDDVGDIIVGADRENPSGVRGAGRAYVFSGADRALVHTLESPSIEEYGAFGRFVSSIHSVDDDGVPDLVVGAPWESNRAGRAYVFNGATGALLHSIEAPGSSQSGWFGFSIAEVGDWTGDGMPDVAVGAPRADGGTGRVYIIDGATWEVTQSIEAPNGATDTQFGAVLTGDGDVDGDGIRELIVGVPEATVNGQPGAGRVYVFDGNSSTLQKTLISPLPYSNAQFGASLSTADVLDDERDDLFVGEPLGGDLDGAAYQYTASLLPVELTSLTALEVQDAVRLQWKTASETQNAGFHVERTSSGTNDWEQLGFIRGAGTTTNPQSYQFVDEPLPHGEESLIYRLRQVDFDGSAEYSPEVEVQLGRPSRLTLSMPFPNPISGQATIQYALPSESAVEIAAYDILGRRVATWVDKNQPEGRYEILISARRLSSGVYVLRLSTEHGVRTQKLTVVQ